MTLPLFLALIFGVMEFGLAFRSSLTASTTAREATRFAATVGNAADADYQIVAKIREMVSGVNGGSINSVVVYKTSGPKVTTASGSLAACRTSSQTGVCNRYTTAQIQALDVTTFGCGPAALDRFWCPTTRKVRLSDPPDYVGIFLSVHHNDITGMFNLQRDFTDDVVFRMEPVRL